MPRTHTHTHTKTICKTFQGQVINELIFPTNPIIISSELQAHSKVVRMYDMLYTRIVTIT